MTLPIPNGNGGIKIGSETLHRLAWHIGQLLATVFVAGVVWSRIEYKMDTHSQEIAAIRAYQTEIDKGGTRKSHETDLNQQTQIDELTRRMVNLEGVMRDLVPKVERIDANLLTLIARDKK